MNKHNTWVRSLARIEDFINYQYSGVTRELPIEMQCRSKCLLEEERYLNYPTAVNRRNWKDIETFTKVRLEKQAERRNKHCVSRLIEFKIGQLVLVKKENLSSASRKISAKLNPLYAGPFEILKTLSASTYVIGNKDASESEKIYNIRHLYPYVKRDPQQIVGMIIEGSQV